MSENFGNLITIAEAARQKSCTRQSIYRAIKKGMLNTRIVAERQLVVRDEAFERMPILKSSEPALKKRLSEVEKEVGELRSALQGLVERIGKLEGKGEIVTKVRQRWGKEGR